MREAVRDRAVAHDVWHNRARRHSNIGYLTPIDFELQSEMNTIPARTTPLIR